MQNSGVRYKRVELDTRKQSWIQESEVRYKKVELDTRKWS